MKKSILSFIGVLIFLFSTVEAVKDPNLKRFEEEARRAAKKKAIALLITGLGLVGYLTYYIAFKKNDDGEAKKIDAKMPKS